MSRVDETTSIQLSQWYACFTTNSEEIARLSPVADSVRIGPLAVFNPGDGCETATFGSQADLSAVIFDGYLFDRRVIQAELGLTGPVTDAELVAAAYQKWGADVFDKLDGCYLIAIWDPGTRQLLIGHDALGRHPVFYATERGAMWFSSNVLALARSDRVSRRPNRLSLALALAAWWPEAGQTFFDAVHRLRPGHYLQVSAGLTVSERKYWDPLPEDDEPWLPDEEAIEAFEPALTRAVARCMDLGAQGIMLSGGVDSVTVAALAAEHWTARRASPLVAVSGRTGRALTYEEVMQTKVTEALAMPHLVSTTAEWTGGRDDVSLSLEDTEQLPSPSRVYWVGTSARFYRRTSAQRLNVLLTGAGGDNWLGVADTHAADLIRNGQLVQLVRFMKADVSTGGSSIRRSARGLLWTSGLRPLVDTQATRFAPQRKARYHRRKWRERLPAWLCPDRELREELVERLLNRRTPGLTVSGGTPRSYYRHSLRSAPNPYMHYENETAHHIETSCGLRLLSPYHDRRLVSFLNRISPKVLVRDDRYKGLLRPIVAKRLPQLGLERQRKHYSDEGQQRALADLRQSLINVWGDARFDRLKQLGVVGSAAATGETVRHSEKGFDDLVPMFIMMSAERWLGVHANV
jgi:asparagine synthetase B (glutamine-hydrolysing)